MRALLEYLGIVEPGRTRREPVALPAWARWAAPLVPVIAMITLTVACTGVWLVVRSLLF